MAVKKVGKKWFPIGKKGNTWKTGFPTEAKAKTALTKSNAYFKSKGSGKKKTTKKKTTKKKTESKSPKSEGSGRKMTKKRSWVGLARLGVYLLAAGGAAIDAVAREGVTKQAANTIAQRYTGRDRSGKFDAGTAAFTYTPLAVVAIVDGVASKLGVYKRMGSV